jgi:glycosyltransferase involved in cell wall biosynthesis
MKKNCVIGFMLFIVGTNAFCKQFNHVSKKYQYDFAVCGIFQNEARFLREWIEFHKIVGAQHFYLYDNKSTDNFRDILAPYIESGLVEVIEWSYSNANLNAQNSAFSDCIKRTSGIVKWVAFLDLDEYLFPVAAFSLVDFLVGYEHFGGVCVNWVMYGTSQVQKIPLDGLMIECLVKCDPRGNKHIKSIVRPDRVLDFNNPHFARYRPGYYQVNADKVEFDGPYSPYIAIDKVRINHYWTRDIDYLYSIKLPRAESLKTNMMVLDDDSWYVAKQAGLQMTPTEWTLAVSAYMNRQPDYCIYKYKELLRKALFLADE